MRALSLVFATVVTLLIASTVSAALPISYIDYPVDNTNPTVRSCIAFSAYGQKCRRCDPNYSSVTGAVTGFTCVPVTDSNNFCTCGDTSGGRCTPKGLCEYK